MRVLGIDPGTVKMGFGIVEETTNQLKAVAYGVISVPARSLLEKKLLLIYRGLQEVIGKYHPEEVALEEPFVSENVRSAMSIGRAQAIAFLAASEKDLPIFRYSPSQVKLQATNYGGSSKEQVAEIVKIQLNLRDSIIAEDATDALAVAICHLNQCHIDKMTREYNK
jgi:crossover junction endodeoxyribonuclease RuvC